ncbi:class E sortase [Kocuria sp. NPDC057446]|uniref:class E sortase n=1 Tax=Kocuria sp. NPDC057446 TaxID=3346137 RepID=UPI0036D203B3
MTHLAGELLITVGALLGLFLLWQLWWTNIEANSVHEQAVAEMTERFNEPQRALDATSTGGDPVVATAPAYGQDIGIIYIPRFGPDYARPVIEGTGPDVLDTLGIGHYPDTAMPGDTGNFSLAGHRQTNGKVFDLIHTLETGDHIHLRTAQGYYTYTVISHKIVAPTHTQVIAPNPENPQAAPEQRLLTLTSCHPRYGDAERYIVHAELGAWRPTQTGPPPEIATIVAAHTSKE